MRRVLILLAFLSLSLSLKAQLVQKSTFMYVKAGINIDVYSPASGIAGALSYDNNNNANADFQIISPTQLSVTFPLMKYVIIGFSTDLGISNAFGYAETSINDTIWSSGGDGNWVNKGISLSTGIEYHPMGIYARRFNPYVLLDFRYSSIKASYTPSVFEFGLVPSDVDDVNQSVSVLSVGVGISARLAERTFLYVESRMGTAGEGIGLTGTARTYSQNPRSQQFNFDLDKYYNFQFGLVRKIGRN